MRGACPHDRPDTCALQISVQGGRVVRVQGDAAHPATHGALCTKVSRCAERTYHAEPVLQPLKRAGPKGAGRFEPVSWDGRNFNQLTHPRLTDIGRGPSFYDCLVEVEAAGG